jgi:signal transduction histidine kinase/CheY-like chemotaxis protein
MGLFKRREKKEKNLKIAGAKIFTIIREEFPRLSAVFFAFFFMVLVGGIFVIKIEEEQSKANVESVLDTAQEIIYADFREAEIAVLSAAFSLQSLLRNGQTPEAIQTYLESLAKRLGLSSSGISGFLNIYGYINGYFISGDRRLPPSGYNAEDRPWYSAAMENTDEAGFTRPSYDPDAGKIVLSVAKALKSPQGEIIGVIALDMDIDDISAYIIGLWSSLGGYGTLLDQGLAYIAHPDARYIGKPLADVSAMHAELADGFIHKKIERYAGVKLRNERDESLVAFFRKLNCGWYVGIGIPSGVYYQNTYLRIFILSALGFIFMIALNYLLLQISGAKKRADEENKNKSSFLARMSHEIRTPMNAILSLAEIILRKNPTKDIRDQILIIKQSGVTLLALINDILDFSQFEAGGGLRLESKKYEFAPLINDVVNVICTRLEGKSIDFFVSADGNIPAVLEGDEIRIRQLLINLLNNAVKYTKTGSISLDVTMKMYDSKRICLYFKITDTGIGIKAKDIKTLFNEFTRVDPERNAGVEGTGLGLAIANSICQAMGGEITVSSVYERGSIFTASVIQSFDDDKRSASVDSAELKKTLVFEDRPFHLKYLKTAFENLKITASYKTDIEEVTRDLERNSYDFAFVPAKYATECIRVWGKRSGNGRLIVMAETRDNTAFDNTATLLLPVYSLRLMDILNGASKNTDQDECKPDFIAPSAYALVVDDIITNVMVAEELLQFHELQVDTCTSGGEALDLARKNRYDLIFMDYMMPEMDGLETARRIRIMGDEDPYYRKVPIIVLTADILPEHRQMFFQNGLNDFLGKPIEMKKLCDILRKWIPQDKIKYEDQAVAQIHEDSQKIDVKTGIKNTGGSLGSYLKVLQLFNSDSKDRSQVIRQTASSGDIRLYTTMVHGLKSASRTIGAAKFGDFAEEMEAAGRNNDLLTIRRRTNELLSHLDILFKDIEAFLQQNSSEIRESAPPLSKEQLQTLRQALAHMEMEKLDRLISEYGALSLNAASKKFLEGIEEDILLFEFERAIKKIDELLNDSA